MKPAPYEPRAGNESDPTPPNQSHTHAKPDKTFIRIYDCLHARACQNKRVSVWVVEIFEDPNLYDTDAICVL